MEGRVPPAGGDDTDENSPVAPPLRPPPPLPPPPNRHSDTYVIQVPIDQIYRVPPPENARIAERHRSPRKIKRRTSCCSPCLLIIGLILAVLVLVGIALLAFHFVFLPKGPMFSIARLLVKNPKPSNHKYSQPGYEISLGARNPNKFMAITYNNGEVTILSFKGEKIATGKFPTFYQEANKPRKIKVFLKGSNGTLPCQIEKRMKDKKSKLPVSLVLAMKVRVKMKLGAVKTWSINTDVACTFKARTLESGTRILSQECQTQFKS